MFKFWGVAFPLAELVFLTTMFAVVVLTNRALQLLSRKELVISAAIFSPLLAISFVIGRKINLWAKPYFEYFKLTDSVYFLMLSMLLFVVVLNLLDFVCSRSLEISSKEVSYKFLLTVFAIILLCWLPYLLVYYPANLSPDSFSTINQSIGITKYYNHHPIMFTLFAQLFIRLGMSLININFGCACFSFAQMSLLSLVLAYCVYFLKKKGLPLYLLVLVTLFFAVNPVIAMYSITMWKDILFGGWVLLMILYLYEVMETDGALLRSIRGISLLGALCMLVAFGRNNGFYVVVAVLFALAVYFRESFKILVPTFLAIILSIGIIQGPVYTALNIGKGNFAESVGIPLQQIGYTMTENGSIRDEPQQFLNQLLPPETIVEVYRPNSPDYIKFHPDFNNGILNENQGEFIKAWVNILPANFIKYVKAWLMQTIGYYHIGTTNWVVCGGVMEDYPGVHNINLIPHIVSPALGNLIPKYINAFARNVPVINLLYSIAFMVWTTFFCAVVLALRKRAKYIIALLPLIAIWGTMMIAAPTYCEFRYMFSFHLALPFVVLLMFCSKSDDGWQTTGEVE